jgi:hypothetical protein
MAEPLADTPTRDSIPSPDQWDFSSHLVFDDDVRFFSIACSFCVEATETVTRTVTASQTHRHFIVIRQGSSAVKQPRRQRHVQCSLLLQ